MSSSFYGIHCEKVQAIFLLIYSVHRKSNTRSSVTSSPVLVSYLWNANKSKIANERNASRRGRLRYLPNQADLEHYL